ncbi:MAG: exodeoxyribonuclease VII small subunit [Eubacteriales bacterium]|nr:exodeoxyribonuclease VII small subunit [Eubacteriales bacterium]
MAKTNFSMEEAFLELEGIIKSLEDPDVKLADSMSLYKKGVKLLEKCHSTLDKTEKEIIILQEGYNGNILKETD